MRNFKFFKVVMALVLCMIMVQPASANGASAKIYMPETVKSGDSFSITVEYQGDEFSRVDAQLEYDTEYIKYVSGGTSSGNSGIVQLSDYGDENGDIEFVLNFEAKKEGQTTVFLDTSELYNYGEEYLQIEQESMSVNIEKEEVQNTEEESTKEDVTENVESVDEETDSEESIETENIDENIDENLDNHSSVPFNTIIVLGVILGVLLVALMIAVLRRK